MRSMEHSGEDEVVDLVDRNGRPAGSARRRDVHGNPSLLHPVVHVHIVNKAGELLLQKRAAAKLVQPGKWDTAVGGHIVHGETVDEALVAEVREELGIEPEAPQRLFTYTHTNSFESEFVYVHLMQYEGPFCINPEELDEVRFWPMDLLEASLHSGDFTSNFAEEFPMLKPYLLPR
jgi:isopentenyldiphosphate isomerase